jgi:hypothetical protein
MEMVLGTGLDHVKFGMVESEVKSIYGQPDKVVPGEEGGIDYQYYTEKVTCRFYKDDGGKLAWIETENPGVLLFGAEVIGKNRASVIELLARNGYENHESEEYEVFDTIFYADIWLELEITYDTISRIKFGAWMDKNENYIWRT